MVKDVVGRLFSEDNLNTKWLENTLQASEDIDRLESFVSKFSRMQDMFVDKLLPLFFKLVWRNPKNGD